MSKGSIVTGAENRGGDEVEEENDTSLIVNGEDVVLLVRSPSCGCW